VTPPDGFTNDEGAYPFIVKKEKLFPENQCGTALPVDY
jgi:hypothetical protein